MVSQKYPNSRIDADASSDRVFRSGEALKVDIVMVPNVDEAVPAITRRLSTLQLVRIEGFCGVGKTRLAHRLSEITGATHIATDIFAFRPDRPSPYRDCIKRPELAAEIKRATAASNLVVLDGVCLDEVAPQAEWGRGLLVYVKRLSLQSGTSIWHDGIDLEDGEVPHDEPGRSIFLYNAKVRPDHRADLILELPGEFDSLPPGELSRGLCFDPPKAIIRTR